LQRTVSSYVGYLGTARRLRDVLRAADFDTEASFHYLEIDGVFHDEQAWAGRMEPLLKFFFPADMRQD
jgi:hypothetical protein